MKINVTFIIISLLFWTSCSNPPAKIKEDTFLVDSSSNEMKIAHKDNKIIEDTFSTPTKSLIDIVGLFDSAGFKSDTNRIKKVPYYFWTNKPNPVFVVKNISFYKMNKQTNRIFQYLNILVEDTFNNSTSSKNHRKKVQNSINIIENDVLEKVKKITGFYFTSKSTSDIQTDGFVEEWEFLNATEAQSAERALTDRNNSPPMYYFIYPNSFSQVFRKNNYLYTFYSRACWDGRLLEKIYGQIINKVNPDSWTKVEIHY